MSSCSIGEYEPESWKQMNDDLKTLKNDSKMINKGFYPNNEFIKYYLNIPFWDEFQMCPFCIVERKGEIVTIKSKVEEDIKQLNESLNEIMENKIRRRKRQLKLKKEFALIDTDFRVMPIEKFILKLEHIQHYYPLKQYYQLTVSYSLIKLYLRGSIEDVISNHKELMNDYRYEFEDSPKMFDDALNKAKYELEDTFYKIQNGNDCDTLIRCLTKVIDKTKQERDSRFTKKLDSFAVKT